MFFTVEYDFDSMSIDLSGRNFAKIIAKDSGAFVTQLSQGCHPTEIV